MSQFIQAIYENGVFKPLEVPNLVDHQQVRLIVEERVVEESNSAKTSPSSSNGENDPLAGVRASTGISDLAENFDDYRLGRRKP